MKLFFSYGHDKNEEIVLRLKSDLERRNHSVWIDKSKIKSGDDWRKSITSGILDSEFLMSFASQHSVRKPGVCLDELMIAVSVKGAQVQTVLLESDVIPPANIGYRQYIDMSCWAEIKGTPAFDSWYQQKLDEVLAVIESPETETYAAEMDFLKEQLHPDLSSAKKDRLQQEYFCGREWLSEKVSDWLKDPEAPKTLLIDGAPGIGKSSFMAHEFIFNASVGSVLFCEWDNPNFNNIDSIGRILVFQLASKIPDYRNQIVHYLKDEQQRTGAACYKTDSGDSVFRFLLLQQLRSMIDGGRPVILILIDGVDEIREDTDGGRKRNAFAEMLQQEAEHFPRWVRFVITSRCDTRVTMPFQNTAFIHMDHAPDENRRDIRQYLLHELNSFLLADDIEKLVCKCDGNFLYARMISDSLKKGHFTLENVLSGENGDLSFVYRHYFDRAFPRIDEYEEVYYPVIAALTVTEERIPEETFFRITGWTRRRFLQHMKTLRPFLSSGRESLGLYHKSIQEWLLREDADEYMVDAADGVCEILSGCYASYADCKEAMNLYELKYLIPYLEKARDPRLQTVLADEAYAVMLTQRARAEEAEFHYESAALLEKMAVRIYQKLQKHTHAAEACLAAAEITDQMVRLDDSEKWCQLALEELSLDTETVHDELSGKIRMRLGYVFFRQAKWDKTITAYRDACACFEACGNTEKQIEVMVLWGNALRNATDYPDALALFQKIETMPSYEMLREKNAPLFLNFLLYYGWTHHSACHYTAASSYLEAAEELLSSCENLVPNKDIAQLYYLRAVEIYNRADYTLSKAYCEKALIYLRKAYGENAVEICSVLNELGAIEQKQNHFEKAEMFFEQSYQIRQNYYGDNNLFTSISLRNYAKALILAGDPQDLERARTALEQVRLVREKLVRTGKGQGWLAQVYLDLAAYYQNTGDTADADRLVDQSVALYRQYGSDRDIIACEKQYGMNAFARGDFTTARQWFEHAISLCGQYYNDTHPNVTDLYDWVRKCSTSSAAGR